MDITYAGKNIDITEGIKAHLEDKIHRLDKYSHKLVESHVVLNKQKYFFEAEITLLAKNLRAHGKAQSKENVFGAIDLAYSKIEKQLKKHQEKLKAHHAVHGDDFVTPKIQVAQKINEGDGDSEGDLPQIILEENVGGKPMSVGEASLQLQLSERNFVFFLNAETKKMNVIYEREDGDYGLIDS